SAGAAEVENGPGARPVVVDNMARPGGRDAEGRSKVDDERGRGRLVARKVNATANGALARIDTAFQAKQRQRLVGRLLPEGAEGRPFAADKAEGRRGARQLGDKMIARDAPGEARIAVGQ